MKPPGPPPDVRSSPSLRVLLVYTNRTRILEPTPPIGLSYVATATRAAGHQVRFVDLMVSRDPHMDLRRALKRAGFISLVISPDSASETMLGNLRKGFTVEQVRNTARWARASGLHCAWFFLFGGPGETNATAEETVSFVEEHLNWKRFLTVMMTGVRILRLPPLPALRARNISVGLTASEHRR